MIFEYLWLDSNQHIRSKIRNIPLSNLDTNKKDIYEFLDFIKNKQFYNLDLHQYHCYYNKKQAMMNSLKQLKYFEMLFWGYDGSSTGQANGNDDTEITLIPVNIIAHPFISIQDSFLVLCENFDSSGNPVHGNTRTHAVEKFNDYIQKQKDLWFGIEQEFFFFDKQTKKPIGWNGSQQIKQGEYYCGVNRSARTERLIMNELLRICNKVGILISGINQEVAPAQWEYQIGPCHGIETADQLIFTKYILYILCEESGLYATFHPKPLNGDWNGSGCHINISSSNTREGNNIITNNGDANINTNIKNQAYTNGYKYILNAIKKMNKDHKQFLLKYCGKNNEMRLTGSHETSDPETFTYGVAKRNCSIRIPTKTFKEKCGYIEDRRPGSSIDYYSTITKYLDYFD